MTFDDILYFLDHDEEEFRSQAGDVIAMALQSGVKKHVIDIETLNNLLKDYIIHDNDDDEEQSSFSSGRLDPHPVSADCTCWTCCNERGEY